MADKPDDECPKKLLSQRIEKANELLKRCDTLEKRIEGLQKLRRKIAAELKFLTSLTSSELTLKNCHIKSTNLSFLEAVLLTLEGESDVTAVFKPVYFMGHNSTELNCILDIVANSGCCWIKVTARNASALHRIWQGQGDFGDKDIVHQAKELKEASKQHPVNYSPPLVVLSCLNGITESLAKALGSSGICVKGKLLPDPGSEAVMTNNTITDDRPLVQVQECKCVNLDITTMVAYVSALTNGGCGFVFKEAILSKQAKQERLNPVLPKLKSIFKGKELFACQSAVQDFNEILKTVGGEKERERARVLLEKVTIVEDNPSIRSTSLKTSASVKERSKIIFGTGDSLKAITTTANVAFTRAAASQGVEFSVFIHESRALTESKEPQASLDHLVQDVT